MLLQNEPAIRIKTLLLKREFLETFVNFSDSAGPTCLAFSAGNQSAPLFSGRAGTDCLQNISWQVLSPSTSDPTFLNGWANFLPRQLYEPCPLWPYISYPMSTALSIPFPDSDRTFTARDWGWNLSFPSAISASELWSWLYTPVRSSWICLKDWEEPVPPLSPGRCRCGNE